MAGAENLKQKILEEARLQAQENIERAEKEAAEIIKSAREEADRKQKEIVGKAVNEAVDRKKRIIAVAELEGRKQKLQTKQDMIEEAFKKAVDSLNSLPDDQYEEILTNMIVDSAANGEEEVILSPIDRKRVSSDFIKNISSKLKSKGVKGNIKLSDASRDINGGFILKTGDIEINNSFEAIIKMKYDELEALVIKALF